MADKELIEVLERIADALECIQSDVKLLPAPLEDICSNTGAIDHLRWVGDAAELWHEQQFKK